jgi:hypothetical protein
MSARDQQEVCDLNRAEMDAVLAIAARAADRSGRPSSGAIELAGRAAA